MGAGDGRSEAEDERYWSGGGETSKGVGLSCLVEMLREMPAYDFMSFTPRSFFSFVWALEFRILRMTTHI